MLNFAKQSPVYAKVWQNAGLDFLYIQDKERLKALNVRTKVQSSSLNNAQNLARQNEQNRQISFKQDFSQNKQIQKYKEIIESLKHIFAHSKYRLN